MYVDTKLYMANFTKNDIFTMKHLYLFLEHNSEETNISRYYNSYFNIINSAVLLYKKK